ncbi:MAG: succinate dehydrogenase, cytochrome b556 subunit [Burkholderiaceae bacterium]
MTRPQAAKQRPGAMRLVDAMSMQYRLPLAGWVSILHRVSGMLMFILLPLVIWLFETSVTSEVSYGQFTSAFTAGIGWIPGWLVKLAVLGLIWSFLHHLFAGLRHLWMDATHAVGLDFGRQSALFVLAASLVLTLVLGFKLFF